MLSPGEDKEMNKCRFDKGGVCIAVSCYTKEKCGARDEKGNPIYSAKAISKYSKGRNN